MSAVTGRMPGHADWLSRLCKSRGGDSYGGGADLEDATEPETKIDEPAALEVTARGRAY